MDLRRQRPTMRRERERARQREQDKIDRLQSERKIAGLALERKEQSPWLFPVRSCDADRRTPSMRELRNSFSWPVSRLAIASSSCYA